MTQILKAKEERAKIPPQRWERVTASYHKCFIVVLTANGGTDAY